MSSIIVKKNIPEYNDSFDNDTSLNKEETKSEILFSSEESYNMFNKNRILENQNFYEILYKNQEPFSLNKEEDNLFNILESATTNKNYFIKIDDSKEPHEEDKNSLIKGKSLIGKKTKSNHQQEDAETVEMNDNSDKKDKQKSDKKSKDEQKIINDFKQTFFSIYIRTIFESSENLFNCIKSLIFFLLVNLFVHSDDKNNKHYNENNNFINNLETNFNKWKWKEILKEYFTVVLPNEEYILFLNKILDVCEDKKNDPENKNTIELLDLTPFKYFKEVIDKGFGKQHNYSNGKQMIKNILDRIKCLILQIVKKNIKEIKEEKIVNNNINQNFIDSQSDNSGNNLDEELNNDFKAINVNKVNDNNNLQINDNNKSTNYSSNDTNITKTFKIEKKIRRDNLLNVLKNMILKAFEIVFKGKIQKKNIFYVSKPLKDNEEKKEGSDFTEYAEKLKEELKINKVNKEVENLIKMTKKEFLKGIMEDKYKEFITKKEFLEIDEEEQKTYFKNLKCKIKAIEIFKSNDLDGLILLTKLINIDQDFYIKIINPENFEKTIKILDVYKDFNIYLNFGYNKDNEDNEDNVDKYITKRRDKLEKIINDIICEKKAKINKVK